jgi:hypothetical protein
MMTHTNLLQLVTKAFSKYAFMMFAVALVYSIVSIISASSPLQAETGKGTDVFKVIMTIFGVDKSKGDVVGIVTSNGVAKVKLLDAEASYVIPLNSSEAGVNIIEYVATFPNVTVNAGDEYKACVLPVNDLALKCTTGQNSPASRPEFVDITLSDTPTAAASTTTQESAGIETPNNEDDISNEEAEQ